MATSPCGAVLTHSCDLGAFDLHPDGPASLEVFDGSYVGWLAAGGEESVNPVFHGEVTAVCSGEENALLCRVGWERSAPGGWAG